jgi:hypothetical protein
MPLDNYSQMAFRMGVGFPGDLTRMTPAAKVEPCLADPTNPPTALGQAVQLVAASGGVAPVTAAAQQVWGVTVRGYPMQPPNASGFYGQAPFGNVSPWLTAGNPNGAVDVLRSGYMTVQVNGTPVRGGAVFIWIAATAAPHVQGGFEAAGTVGSTVQLPQTCTYQSGPDANGVCELAFNIGITAVVAN